MSPLATKDRCRSCRAAISFGITAKGKRMPLDVEPVESLPSPLLPRDLRGLQVFVDRSSIRSATIEDVGRNPIFRSHFATCPDADRFRR